MGGKGALAKSALGKSIARTNTSATVWGAGEETTGSTARLFIAALGELVAGETGAERRVPGRSR
jgi:ribose 5-phosphate isomerase